MNIIQGVQRLVQHFKTEFIYRLDPDQAYLKQAIRTGLAGMLAVIIFRLHPQWTEGYWIILAAAFLMQTRLGHSQLQQMASVLICGFFAALFASLAGFFWHYPLLLASYLAITTFITIYIGVLGLNVAIAGFFVNLFVIMSAGLISSTTGQTERFFMILLGDVLAIGMCLLFPTHTRDHWHHALKAYFVCVSEFSDRLSEIFNQPEVKVKKFAKRFQERRNRMLRFLNSLRSAFHYLEKKSLLNATEIGRYSQLLQIIERVNKSLLALVNLNYKLLQDPTIPIIADNIIALDQSIASYFKNMAAKIPNATTLAQLKTNIKQLQTCLRNTPDTNLIPLGFKINQIHSHDSFAFIAAHLGDELEVLTRIYYET
jgi:uncharacterized membrane protein YccC